MTLGNSETTECAKVLVLGIAKAGVSHWERIGTTDVRLWQIPLVGCLVVTVLDSKVEAGIVDASYCKIKTSLHWKLLCIHIHATNI